MALPHPNVLWIMAAGLVALALGTGVRLVLLRGAPPERAAHRLGSLKTWWGAAVLVGLAVLLGRTASALLFLAVGGVGFREFVKLTATPEERRSLVAEGLLLLLISYGLAWAGWRSAFAAFLPLAGLIWVAARFALLGTARGGPGVMARWYLGLMLTGYGLAHAPLLFALPGAGGAGPGAAGWLLLLVMLVELNDIAQALIGGGLGRRPIAPVVSPRKTWEGFVGGLAVTVLLGALMGPRLTSLDVGPAAGLGLALALLAFVGDLTISAVKRESGVKDSGSLLPGHGGMLDRVDSLLLATPVFFYLMAFLG